MRRILDCVAATVFTGFIGLDDRKPGPEPYSGPEGNKFPRISPRASIGA